MPKGARRHVGPAREAAPASLGCPRPPSPAAPRVSAPRRAGPFGRPPPPGAPRGADLSPAGAGGRLPPAVGGSPAAAGGTSARGRRPPANSGGRPRPTPSSRAVLGLGPGFASLLSEADGRWRASWSEAPRSWLRFPLLTRHHRCRPEHGRLLTSFCNHKG